MSANNTPKVFHIFVDGEELLTPEHQLTAQQILLLAKVDPASHYLVGLQGNSQQSYQPNPGEAIHIHEKAKFVTVSNGPTTVS